MNKKQDNNINNIPSDLLRFISLYLQIPDLIQFSYCNKRNKNSIYNSNFEKQYALLHLTSNPERIVSHTKPFIIKGLCEHSKKSNEKFSRYIGEKGYDIYITNSKHELDMEYLFNGALYNGHLDVMKYAHEKCVEICIDGDDAYNAVEHNHIEAVKYISKQYDIDGRYKVILEPAINCCNLELVKYLKDDIDPEFENDPNNNYTSNILEQAVRSGNLIIVKYLIELGLDIHYDNDVVLKIAIKEKHPDIIKYLIKKGIKPKNKHLKLAVKTGNIDIVKILVNTGLEIKIDIIDAAINSNVELLDFLLTKNIDITKDIDKFITSSAKKGKLEILKYFQNKVGPPSAVGSIAVDIHVNNDEALCLAAENGHMDIVEYLVDQDAPPGAAGILPADINTCDNLPFRLAAANGHGRIVRYLIKKGVKKNKHVDIHACYDEALRFAAKNNHLDMVIFLHQEGANISEQDNYALRFAAANGHTQIVKYLHRNGADILAKNNYCLKKAVEKLHINVIIYLLENGASLKNIDKKLLSDLRATGNRIIRDYINK